MTRSAQSTRSQAVPSAAAATASSAFGSTRFDPLVDEQAQLQNQAAAAFDVCHPALALRAVLLVQAVVALVALGDAHNGADWAARQAALAFAGAAATGLWLVTVCGLQRVLRPLEPSVRAGVVLLLGMACALACWLPLWWAGLGGAGGGAALALRCVAVGLAGLALAALAWAWLDLRARLWHPATASARLAELQSRIRPHFLFNALNTALALVRIDPASAEAVLEDLAQLFRVALAEVGASVTLAEEIDLAQRYLAIEQLRFASRMTVQWQVDPDPRVQNARVPPLVLQPLVENAVRHGIEPSALAGSISIGAGVQRGQVVVEVVNTLPSAEDGSHAGHGMALHNLRQRLRLLHDVQAQCEVWREPAAAPASAARQAPAGQAAAPAVDRFHARIVLPLP